MTDLLRPAGPTPSLHVRPPIGPTRAVILFCYGGKAKSHQRSRTWHLSALRLLPFARAAHRTGESAGVAVGMLRYRYRGWNGAEQSPVADARWALAEIRHRYGGVPVVLVGHSLGGRTVLHAADDHAVVGVVGLAPWCEPNESVAAVRGRRVYILHGTRDRWTDPAASLDFARRAQPIASVVRWLEVRGVGHFMLRRVSVWQGLTTGFALGMLLDHLPAGSLDQSVADAATNTGYRDGDDALRLVV